MVVYTGQISLSFPTDFKELLVYGDNNTNDKTKCEHESGADSNMTKHKVKYKNGSEIINIGSFLEDKILSKAFRIMSFQDVLDFKTKESEMTT